MKVYNSNNTGFAEKRGETVNIKFTGINTSLEVIGETFNMKTSPIKNVEIRNGLMTFETESGSYYSFEV